VGFILRKEGAFIGKEGLGVKGFLDRGIENAGLFLI
jgi:hypothetical protein